MKLRGKLIALYILISTLPILLLGWYLTSKLNDYSVERSKTVYSYNLTQIGDNLATRLESYSNIAADIALSSDLVSYLEMEGQSDLSYYNYYIERLAPLFNRATYRENDLTIHVYTENQELRFSHYFERRAALVQEKMSLLDDELKMRWQRAEGGAKEGNLLYHMVAVRDYNHPQIHLGVVEVGVDVARLEKFFDGETAAGNWVYLFDGEGRVLLSNARDAATTKSEALQGEGQDGEVLLWKGQEVLYLEKIMHYPSKGIDQWRLGMLVPLTAMQRETTGIWQFSLQLISLCLIVSFLVLTGFSRQLTSRLSRLIDWMKEAGRGKTQPHQKLLKNPDEIGEVSRQFGKMLDQLEQLTRQIIEAKIKEEQIISVQNETQLLALQNQINPHYLFNTLESIRMNLFIKGDRETAETVQLFAESFRYMIEDGEAMVPIAIELEIVKKHFFIQEYRYEGLYRLHLDVEADLLTCLVPKLILQLLVENSLYHGLAPKGEKGNVSISIRKQGADACAILVKDDGVGMSNEVLAELREALAQEHGSGRKYLALRNIVRRLELLYGEKGSFRIDSEEDVGTQVLVILPLDHMEDSPPTGEGW